MSSSQRIGRRVALLVAVAGIAAAEPLGVGWIALHGATILVLLPPPVRTAFERQPAMPPA